MSTLSMKRNGYKRSPLGPYYVKVTMFRDERARIIRSLDGKLLKRPPSV